MKHLLLVLSFFIPALLYAQSTIDFETVGQDWYFDVFANGPSESDTDYTVAANPSVGGINTSANCGKLVVHPDADPWAGAFTDSIPEFTLDANNCIIRVMVYKDVISNFNFKLEFSPGFGHDVNVPNTLINQWEELIFDYSADIGQAINRLTIIPDFTDPRGGVGSTTYFDNITFTTMIPVELTSFTGSFVGKDVKLNWVTATELNNRGFEVQRSSDKAEFKTIAFIDGKGTATQQNQYSYVDRNVLSRTEYSYRLKQIDFDGTYSYSNVINLGVSLPSSIVLDQNYPNPFNPVTKISFALPFKSRVSLDIYNLLGQKVMTLAEGELEEGTHSYDVNASDLSSGIYIYSLSATDENGLSSVITRKMTLLK